MGQFTFEEINLICCYIANTKRATATGMTAALPFMEPEIKEFAERTLEKLNGLTEEEFAGLSFEPAEE